MVGHPFGNAEPDDKVTPFEGFAKRQAAVRGTRLLAGPATMAGKAMMAYGLSPRPITYISHVRPQTAYDRKRGTGKGFLGPRTDSSGRTFTRGLGKKSPTSRRHGYNTGSRHTKHKPRIRSRTLSVAGGAVYGTGKALPIIGYGYVVGSLYSDYKSGKINNPSDASRQIQGYTFGMTVSEAADTSRGLLNKYKRISPTAITVRGFKEMAQRSMGALSFLRR